MSTTTFNHGLTANYSRTHSVANIFTRFINWCHAQEHNRLLWIGITLVTHGCIITPLAVIAIVLSGGEVPMIAFGLVMLSMVMVLVTNLAALPTKITIPVYALSIIADVAIVMGVLL